MKNIKMRDRKGITLIALVITIIVLLILAGVGISMLSGENGLLKQAANAKLANEKGNDRDEGALSQAEGILSRYNMAKYDATKNNGIATQNSTQNGEKASSTNPVIPKGFKYLEGEVDTGFVIQDEEGNEFVWIPVDGTKVKLELDGTYSWSAAFVEYSREPDLLTGKVTTTEDGKTIADLTGTEYDAVEANRKAILDDGYDNTNEGLKKQFEDEYNAMVGSVKAYGGFYVGRYETGWNREKGIVVSQPGIPMTAATELKKTWTKVGNSNDNNQATWYGLYAKQKELYKKNSSSSVVSGMIYGCQWDAIMNWMLNSEDTKSDVSGNAGWGGDTNFPQGPEGNPNWETGIPLGENASNKIKNIYDLSGNYWEWTQESSTANSGYGRVARGSGFGWYDGAGARHYNGDLMNDSPSSVEYYKSSRLMLYIK